MIAYISSFLPPSQKESLQKANKSNFNPYSAHAFSYSLFEGFSQLLGSDEFMSVNLPPVGCFPRHNRSVYTRSSHETVNGIKIDSVGSSNLYAYQYVSTCNNLYRKLKRLFAKKSGNVFIIYYINVPAIKAVKKFRKNHDKNAKIVLIVPDFLEDITGTNFAARMKMRLFGDIKDIYNGIDGYVLLTENMKERIGENIKFCVVEGIYNNTEKRETEKNISATKGVFYSGMLFEKYGVKNLVDAVHTSTNSNLELDLCGCGGLEPYIAEISQSDKRIKHLGMLPREKVLELQSQSTLLVNPRQPTNDFTKYSFPSKNIEYLVSGTPVLLYQLEGMPDEYYKYCYSIDKEHLEMEHLRSEIERICSLPESELQEKACSAADFIKTEKNCKVQCRKILDLIESI